MAKIAIIESCNRCSDCMDKFGEYGTCVGLLKKVHLLGIDEDCPLDDATQPANSADWLEHYLRELQEFETRSRKAKILVG